MITQFFRPRFPDFLPNPTTAFGGRFLASLAVGALCVPTIGLIFDSTGGFFWVFVALVGVAAASVVAVVILPREQRTAE